MARPAFEIINDEAAAVAAETPRPPPPDKGPGLDVRLLALALRTIAQKTVIALADLFYLAVILSVFWVVINDHEPNLYTLGAEGGYAAFCLAACWIVKRR